ncbi:glutamyl-tRNA reductase [Marinithermofilum abyssi]|uniref:Glutamyl-tRNA reductase n=1 Tax=Marinithermofilum abyssi TaxID=1571185 RepID=A0A8J2VC09_9BACL|nr:glutamyl-tRNA reductase [Marinithermofilum abyssi]GGE18333.1 glutamyl-tRNA reductase [Marinithermofilum abyssi]
MHIIVVGFNHKTAPVELRERMSFSPDGLKTALRRLQHMKSILEGVIVSTCNRLELYVVCDQLHTGKYYAKAFLEAEFGMAKEEFENSLYVKEEEEAVTHLFQVISGLDSMVLGETQILGQVKHAFFTAQDEGATGTMFNRLFQQAVALGKRIHSETEIGENAVSVSYAAVELGKKMFSSFTGKTVLLLGAGETGELTAKHIHEAGADRVLVLNRTTEKAMEVARKFNGEARPLSRLVESLREADIVVSSTGAPATVIGRDEVKKAVHKRTYPLFLIDIAVPRDIDPSVHELDNVFLFDIDDLQDIVAANIQLRKQEAEKAQAMITAEVKQFQEWVQTLGVVPLITALREKALAIQQETIKSIERKLPELTEREKRVLRKHTKSIVNQLLKDPVVRIKELAATSEREQALDMFVTLFALEEELRKKEAAEGRESEAGATNADFQRPAFAAGGVSIRS